MTMAFLLLPMCGWGAENEDTVVYDDDFVIASLYVADPGEKLYSCYGHIGIHMQCPQHNLDYVFSYESELATDNCFRFLAGKLKMGLFAIPTSEYLEDFQKEGRGVREYMLNLPITAKQNLWRVLDNHMMEEYNLPFDYIVRGCAYSTLVLLKEGLDSIPLEYGPWPEKYSKLTRRGLTRLQMDDYPWTRCFFSLICNGEINADCSIEEKIVMPVDLVEVLQNAKVDGKQLLSSTPEIIYPSVQQKKNIWCTPLLVSIVILALTLICIFLKNQVMDYVLLAIQTILGIINIYLVCFSALVCTEWTPLIVPFNALPFIFWKWRKYWAFPYAIVIGIWVVTMLLWPHSLTDETYIVISLALMASYINILYKNRIIKKNI